MAHSAEGSTEDLFRNSFKKYKFTKSIRDLLPEPSKNEETNEVMLLDPSAGDVQSSVHKRNLHFSGTCECQPGFGLRPPSTWKVYDFQFPEGLILIRNPFTREGQRYWIKRSVVDFPKEPFITNIDNLENKEGKSIKAKLNRKEFYKKLRWVTFGYHHNWDTKVYSEDSKSEFPQDLADLTNFISTVLGFSNFKAEAAIANYYHLDSTLSGHVDQSEVNQRAPLFSLSFGQPAVFLIGGRTKTVKPQAVLLRSGDIAVMSGESRMSYHGVPRILHSPDEPWNTQIASGQHKDLEEDGILRAKKPKLETEWPENVAVTVKHDNCDSVTCSYKSIPQTKHDLEASNVEWNEFLKDYVSESRINLNIRQVLFPGQTHLSQKPI